MGLLQRSGSVPALVLQALPQLIQRAVLFAVAQLGVSAEHTALAKVLGAPGAGAHLLAAGLQLLGQLFQAERLDEKYGLVGRITGVNADPVENALTNGYIPVVSTVAQVMDADTAYNINADTAMGTMLKYGSEGAKQFYHMFVLRPEHSKAHLAGDIHIHDLDFLTLTTTCCQIDIDKLFTGGFCTGHGFPAAS